MMNWYDMPGALNGFENNPAYHEKTAADSYEERVRKKTSRTDQRLHFSNSWIKNRNYKKKMVRRFLSINPDMDYSKHAGTSCRTGVYRCGSINEDSEVRDQRMIYDFNIYTRVFRSPRGDLRKFHGNVFPVYGRYALAQKDKEAVKLTNRRIRYRTLDDENGKSYSYCRKLYSPVIDSIW